MAGEKRRGFRDREKTESEAGPRMKPHDGFPASPSDDGLLVDRERASARDGYSKATLAHQDPIRSVFMPDCVSCIPA